MLRNPIIAFVIAAFAFVGCATFAGIEEDAVAIRQELATDQLQLQQDRKEAFALYDAGEISFAEYVELMRQTDELEAESIERAREGIDEAVEDAKERLERERESTKSRGKGLIFSVTQLILLLLGGSAATVGTTSAIGHYRKTKLPKVES